MYIGTIVSDAAIAVHSDEETLATIFRDRINHNFVGATRGDLEGRSNTGLDGSAFWFNSFRSVWFAKRALTKKLPVSGWACTARKTRRE